MKNKSATYIYWGMGVIYLLAALSFLDNGITKQVVFWATLSAVWFVGGLLWWKRRK